MDALNQIRLCANCGSFLQKNYGLCLSCLSRIRLNMRRHYLHNLCIYSLMDWDDSRLVSQLVHQLKGGCRAEAWRYWAQKFLLEKAKARFYAPSALVPAPPRRTHQQDHADFFAQALAAYSSSEVVRVLRRQTAGEQKGRNQAEREIVKLSAIQQLKQDYNLIVFVDDVVTTGNTVRAAHAALGQPKNFEAWALFYREKSSDML